jgi:deazaflavin-dependent oxidoreductase (nitroreductase family)
MWWSDRKAAATHRRRWLLNLQANPEVAVQVGTRQVRARARVANADERRRLWVEFTNLWPNYDRYQAQTSRQIPLVILVPTPQRK